MPVYVNTFFESRVKQLFDLARIADEALTKAGVDYRVVGGLATYLYVEEAAPDAGRLTRDIDIAVRRADLQRIAQAVAHFGLEYRHTAGIDMLVPAGNPTARGAVQLVFTGERVRPEYLEPVPGIGAGTTLNGIRLMPLPDLIRMKLTKLPAEGSDPPQGSARRRADHGGDSGIATAFVARANGSGAGRGVSWRRLS